MENHSSVFLLNGLGTAWLFDLSGQAKQQEEGLDAGRVNE